MGGLTHMLTQRATIKRLNAATNDGPYPPTTAATVATDAACRVVQLSGRELGAQYGAEILMHRIFFEYGVDLEHADIIEVGANQYEVETVNADPGQQHHHVEVLAKEVR